MTATYTPLANITLATAVTGITFGNIPATYRDLVIVLQATRSTSGGGSIRFNGDSAGNYGWVYMDNASTNVTDAVNALDFARNINIDTTFSFMSVINIMDYAMTDRQKMVITRADNIGTQTRSGLIISRWNQTAAINSILITTGGSQTFGIGTIATLYGIIA